jgi:hypothetical protein
MTESSFHSDACHLTRVIRHGTRHTAVGGRSITYPLFADGPRDDPDPEPEPADYFYHPAAISGGVGGAGWAVSSLVVRT